MPVLTPTTVPRYRALSAAAGLSAAAQPLYLMCLSSSKSGFVVPSHSVTLTQLVAGEIQAPATGGYQRANVTAALGSVQTDGSSRWLANGQFDAFTYASLNGWTFPITHIALVSQQLALTGTSFEVAYFAALDDVIPEPVNVGTVVRFAAGSIRVQV